MQARRVLGWFASVLAQVRFVVLTVTIRLPESLPMGLAIFSLSITVSGCWGLFSFFFLVGLGGSGFARWETYL